MRGPVLSVVALLGCCIALAGCGAELMVDGCASDLDCKGARVCVARSCQDPITPPQADSGTRFDADSGTLPDATAALEFCLGYEDGLLSLQERCGFYSPEATQLLRRWTAGDCRNSGGRFPEAAAGRARLDPVVASRCLAELRNASCTSLTHLAPCSRAFVGVIDDGGACYTSNSCASGLYCHVTTGCPGRCRPRREIGQTVSSNEACIETAENYGGTCTLLVPLGQSCAPTSGLTEPRSCVEVAVCTAGVCVVAPAFSLLAAGQSCAGGAGCGIGLSCVSGVCRPFGAAGSSCDSAQRCQADLFCSSGVCSAYSSIGEPCGPSSGCKPDLLCSSASGPGLGSCVPRRTAGQSCVSSSECDPAGGLVCFGTSTSSAVCRIQARVGEACTSTVDQNQCRQSFCTATSSMMSGVCASLKPPGSSCNGGYECQGEACFAGVCVVPTSCIDPGPEGPV